MPVVKLDDKNFNEMTGLAVIDFYAAWCQPCKMMVPIFHQLSDQIKDVKFGSVNVDEVPDLASRFTISSIPTLVFLKDGEVFEVIVGVVSAGKIEEKIEEMRNE
jgi:thioredoxin 1